MARSSLTCGLAAVVLLAAGCGAAPLDRAGPLASGEGWTETSLDGEIARLACGPGGECGEVCRVRAGVNTDGSASREVEHRVGPHGRAVITIRADGSLSLRVAIERGEERLDAVLELAQRGALGADDALRALARPGASGLPEHALVTRTYARAGEAAYVLHETGAAERRTRAERYEEQAGVIHHGRVRSAGYTADTRASIDGRTRTTESVHVRGEGDRTSTVTIEQLDERGRVVRVERRFDASWDGGDATDVIELEYGEGELPSAMTTRYRGEPSRHELAPRPSRASEIGRDAQGRAITYRLRSEEDDEGGAEDLVVIERDAAGRIASIDQRSRWSTSWTLRIERDAAGRVLTETSVWSGRDGAARARTLARTLDAAGRLERVESTLRTREAAEEAEGEAAGEPEPEIATSTVATYEYGDRCAPDVAVPDELDLLPTLDDRVDYVPF